MPSGARKRKSKKKGKKGEADDTTNDHHGHTNSSSNHSHGIEDPKPVDERESDREEEEVGGEEELVDQQEGNFSRREALEEEIVRVEMESKPPENGSRSADFRSTDVQLESPIVVLTSEESVPGNDGVEDKEVAVVEEEELTINGQDASSASPRIPRDEVPRGGDYTLEDEVGVGGDPVKELHKLVEDQIHDDELVKEVVTLAEEVIPGAESAVISDAVNSELMKNEDAISQVSDDKEMFASISEDRQIEKTESRVASVDEDKSVGSGKQLEEEAVTPATTITPVVDSVRSGETHMPSHAIPKTSHQVDNGKDSEIQLQLEKQPLIASNRPPVRSTSWMACCGLFEVFSGANR